MSIQLFSIIHLSVHSFVNTILCWGTIISSLKNAWVKVSLSSVIFHKAWGVHFRSLSTQSESWSLCMFKYFSRPSWLWNTVLNEMLPKPHESMLISFKIDYCLHLLVYTDQFSEISSWILMFQTKLNYSALFWQYRPCGALLPRSVNLQQQDHRR